MDSQETRITCQPAMLCKECTDAILKFHQRINRAKPLDDLGTAHDLEASFVKLERSKNYCSFCEQVVRASKKSGLWYNYTKFGVENLRMNFRITPGNLDAGVLHAFPVVFQAVDNSPIRSGFSSILQNDVLWSWHTVTKFDSRWSTIQEWVDGCNEIHPQCQAHRKPGVMPTRLVKVPNHPGAPPYLVETRQLNEKNIRYTTLSYRWGEGHMLPLRTTESNRRAFSHKIPIDQLPQTFLDAMRITRKLGVHYIWIDALCIIQDCASDWRYEAATMSDVYMGAYLNIAVVDAENSQGGCSLDPEPSLHVALSGDSNPDLKIWMPGTDICDSKLVQRGWVFQELILGTRVLYCSERQFYWQCREHSYSEDGHICTKQPLNHFAPTIDGWNWTNEKCKERDYEFIWPHLSQIYSGLKLTFPKDRVSAFAGITKWFGNEYSLTPFLGCWKEILSQNLYWVRAYDDTAKHSPQETDGCTLPSWTWLNPKYGHVYFSYYHSREIGFIDIIHSSIEWSGEELTSSVLSIELVLRGFQFQIHLKSFKDESTPIPSYFIDHSNLVTHSGKHVMVSKVSYRDDFNLGDASKIERTCLILGIRRRYEGIDLTFLAIEPVDDKRFGVKAKFKRVGAGILGFDFGYGPSENLPAKRKAEFQTTWLREFGSIFGCHLDSQEVHNPISALGRILRQDPDEISLT